MPSKGPSLDVARRRADESSPTRLLRDGDFVAPSSSSDPETAHVYRIDESRKLGIRSSIFLILNKMIGTGSQFFPLWTLSFLHTSDPDQKDRHNLCLQFSQRHLGSMPRLAQWECPYFYGWLVSSLNSHWSQQKYQHIQVESLLSLVSASISSLDYKYLVQGVRRTISSVSIESPNISRPRYSSHRWFCSDFLRGIPSHLEDMCFWPPAALHRTDGPLVALPLVVSALLFFSTASFPNGVLVCLMSSAFSRLWFCYLSYFLGLQRWPVIERCRIRTILIML